MAFNPNEPQNGEIVDATLLRNQLNALNDKITASANQHPAAIALTYAATLTPDASAGLIRMTTLTGNLTVNPPTNAVAGMALELWLTCDSTSRGLSFNPAILIPDGSSLTSPKALTAGKTYIAVLRYSGTAWLLVSFIGGY